MDVREQILVEATRMFAARGFDATPLQGVADAVGIRKPSLLYHFPSKDALRRAVLDKMASHWNEALPRLLQAATSGEDQFNAVVEEMVAFLTSDPDRARLVIREVLDRPDEIKGLMDSHVRSWVAIVCDYIRKGQDRGVVHPDVDPQAYVLHVINLVVSGVATYHSLGSLLATGDGAEQLFARYIRELLRIARAGLFIHGMAQNPAAPSDSRASLGPSGQPPGLIER